MILSNETLREETNNKLEKGEKNNLFLGNNYITKRKGKAFIRPEKHNGNKMECIHLLVNHIFVYVNVGSLVRYSFTHKPFM